MDISIRRDVATVISIGRSHLTDQEDLMISAERAGHPADDEQPRDAQDRDQSCGSDADVSCVSPFDYID